MNQKLLIFIFINLFVLMAFSQKNDMSIHFKDYHYDVVNESVYAQNNDWLFTTDLSGKILMRNTKDSDKTIVFKEGNGFLNSNLCLVRDESILMFKCLDTVYGISLKDKKLMFKNPLKANIYQSNDYLIFSSFNDTQNLYFIEILNKNLEAVHSFTFNKPINAIALSKDLTMAALVVQDNFIDTSIEVYDLKTYKLLNRFAPKEQLRVESVFFNEFSEQFEVLIYDKINVKLQLFDFQSLINVKPPLIEIEIKESIIPKVKVDKIGLEYVIVHYSPSMYSQLVCIKRTANTCSHKSVDSTISFVAISPEKLFVFEHSWSSNKKYHHQEYELGSLKIIEINAPKTNQFHYKAQFLVDDSWLVYQPGTFGSHSEFLKYFDKGTFNNRFFKLNFREYIELNHRFYISNLAFLEDYSGKAILQGYYLNNPNENTLVVYEFIKDQLSAIDNLPKNYTKVIDYQSSSNAILLAQGLYSASQHSMLQLYYDGKTLDIKGNYKLGKISENGAYLLLINSDNQLKIFDIEAHMKLIYEEQLVGANYQIHSIDDDSFIVNFTGSSVLSNCNQKLVAYTINNAEVSLKEQDCVNVSAISLVNEHVAAVFNQNFLMVNGSIAIKNSSKKILHVSLNSAADKLMLTYQDDSIEILDLKTMTKLGEMRHPDNKTHVFVKNNTYFFGNTKYEDYLLAIQNNTIVDWRTVDKTYENPLEVLNMFGNPNQQYVEALQKAMAFKQNINEIKIAKNQESSEVSSLGSNLYVLSIGVSDYLQNEYSLTFADKDALDIVKIFGQFDTIQNKAYLDRFYGKKIVLKQNNKAFKSLNSYYSRYISVGDFFPLNHPNFSWFALQHDTYSFFDFNQRKSLRAKLPEKPLLGNFVYGISGDKKTFYMIQNGKIIQHDIERATTTEASINNQLNAYHYLNLSDNEWVYYTTTNGIFAINYVDNQHQNTRKTVQFELKSLPYELKDEDDMHPCQYACMASLKSVTSNGTSFLISIGYPSLHYVAKFSDTDEISLIPLLNETDFEKVIDLKFTNDSKNIMLISEVNDLNRYHVYNLEGVLIDSFQLKKPPYFYTQVDYVGGAFYHLEVEESLLEEDVLNFETHESFNNQKATSFTNVYTHYLTNESATKANIEKAVNDFFKNVKPQDQIIVFMAGHGVLDDKNNYLFAPHEMNFNNVKQSGLSYTLLVDKLAKLPSKHKLLLMDTCHSGNVYDEVSGGQESGQRGSKVRSSNTSKTFKVGDIISTLYNNELSDNHLTVISASSGSDVALEKKELGNGAFTHAFINHLKRQLKESYFGEPNWQKPVELNQTFIDEVFKEVIRITNNKQTPDIREINKTTRLMIW